MRIKRSEESYFFWLTELYTHNLYEHTFLNHEKKIHL